MAEKKRILFLCVHNSARSQMAEGLMRRLAGERFEAHSAGLEARGLHPLAVRAMAEAGIDISAHRSKTIDELPTRDFDYVVTTCHEAQEACLLWPGRAQLLHWSFPDPSAPSGSQGERLAVFREVRDSIAERIRALLADLADHGPHSGLQGG